MHGLDDTTTTNTQKAIWSTHWVGGGVQYATQNATDLALIVQMAVVAVVASTGDNVARAKVPFQLD
jgi:hypothetical protein